MKRTNSLVAGILVIAVSFLLVAGLSYAAPANVITWKAQNNYPDPAGPGPMAITTARWIEEITQGRLKINIVAAPGIVSVADSFSAVSRGVVDALMCSYGAIYQGIIPEAVILPGPPYAWENSAESFDAYYNRGLLDIANALHAKHNVYFVPHLTTGIRFIGSKVPIDTIAKLKGMKIRAIGTDAKYLEKFGASTVNIPGPDIYMAIKTGIVDATLISLSAIGNYFDVWKYYVISPNYGGDNGALLFNLKSWKALPEDIRFTLEHALKYQTLYSGAFTYNETVKRMQEARVKHGIEFIRWSAEDTAKALEAAASTYDDLAKISPEARKMVDIIRQQMKDAGKLQ